MLPHHDPPWQRPHFAHITELPADDPAWRHVVINELTRHEFADRGLTATRIYNGFPTETRIGSAPAIRAAIGASDDEVILAHPVRAIPRKDVPAAIALTEAIGATYWLWGPAEDGYDDELAEILAAAGFNFLLIDLEHGPAGEETALAQVLAAERWGARPIIRVAEARDPWIKKALDLGAAGLMAPAIHSRALAEQAVAAAHYGPSGRRGVATRIVRAAGYGADPDYESRWNDVAFLIAQIESPEALANVAEIASTPVTRPPLRVTTRPRIFVRLPMSCSHTTR